MHRPLILSAALAAALALAACNNRQESAKNANPGQSEPVNTAQDTVGAAVGQTSAATLGQASTPAFTSNAAESNMYEIEAARMAQQKGQHADVKAFAQTMITDHTAMMNEMKPLITAAGQTPPTELDQRRKGFLDNLRAASGADFDKAYMTQQVAAHEEALTLMRGYADNGAVAGLKAAAAKAAPKVEQHLQRARDIQTKLGA